MGDRWGHYVIWNIIIDLIIIFDKIYISISIYERRLNNSHIDQIVKIRLL